MFINRDTDYALRALRALRDGSKKPLAMICEEEAIPLQFGYKILKKLANAGYTRIWRGQKGGYQITEVFAEKSLYDLMCVIETPTDICPCLSPGYVCQSPKAKSGACKLHKQLAVMQQSLDDQLRALRLEEILSESPPEAAGIL